MLTGYFDDAGGADHGYTVVAGWISTVERWRAFEVEWFQMLSAYQVPYLDMKTLSHFKGVYAQWKDQPTVKNDFLAAACQVIARYALVQFASVVPHKAFASANKRYRLKEYVGNEYAMAGVSCAHDMRVWSRKQHVPSALELVFDDGTAKRGKLTDLMRKEGFAEPIFRSPSGAQSVLPLQAADFLAYEIRKVIKHDPDETRAVENHRVSLRKLIFVPSHWAIFTEENLIDSCEKHPRIEIRN